MKWKFWQWFSRSSASVAAKRRTFAGDGTWPFIVRIDGADALLLPHQGRKMTATHFGGDNDPHDDGRTASGVMTRGNPGLLGISLPMQTSNGRTVSQCAGSPIVNVPWGTAITVSARDTKLTAPLIDVGPAKWTTDSLDLTRAAFIRFTPLRYGYFRVDSVRIHGGAQYFGA